MERKEKRNITIKTKDASRGNKPESTGERRKTKKESRQKENNTEKIGHSKATTKILLANRGRMHEDKSITGGQGNKTILDQNMGTKRT